MKRWLLGSILFPSTLIVGLCANYLTTHDAKPRDFPFQSHQEVPFVEPLGLLSDKPEFRDVLSPEDLLFPESTKTLIDVLEYEGIYRESEVIAKSGETWLGLYENNGKTSLVTRKATVKKMRTTSYPGDEYDVRLSFDSPTLPYFAIRKIKNIKPGPVTTIYQRPTWKEIERRNLPIGAMEIGYKRDFNLNESWYTLRVTTGIDTKGDEVAVLVLEYEELSQVVTVNYGNIIGNLLWIGDIDNDGKIDLYIDQFNEKGFNGVELYLSSHAADGQLVKLAATFDTAGC